jgi:hypothetical protein
MGATHGVYHHVQPRNMLHVQQVFSTNHTIKGAWSSRMVDISDVEAKLGDELNIQTVKAITGGDDVGGMKVSTSIVCSTNELFMYKDVRDYTRADRAR